MEATSLIIVGLNRLCENSDEAISSNDIPDNIKNVVTQVNESVMQVDGVNSTLRISASNLLLGGLINREQEKEIINCLDKLEKIVNEFTKTEWNAVLCDIDLELINSNKNNNLNEEGSN